MPEKHSYYQARLASLRMYLEKENLDGFIIPRTDEFQGEFIAPYAERLAWLTGFTGSAGIGVILRDVAVVMSDGRYTIQLAQQADGDLYRLADSTQKSVGDWLKEHSHTGARIGYDAWLYTPQQVEKLQDLLVGTGVTIVSVAQNPIDAIWSDQPDKPMAQARLFPDLIAGRTSGEKRRDLVQDLRDRPVDGFLLTSLDSICWLLNVRGGDVDYSPLVMSYAILYADGTLDWFVAPDKIDDDVRIALGDGVRIKDIINIEAALQDFNGVIGMDITGAPVVFEQILTRHGIEHIAMKDPCVLPKSLKTRQEQDAIRAAHIKDGVAVVKFLKWLDECSGEIEMDELSVEGKLEDFRRECPEYLGASFATIAGFAEHGAIVHYRADKDSNISIDRDGLLLVDSGGQYQWGTTDITRTVAVGAPTQEMRENYTRVLKGHIALASARFEKGTTGKEIDVLAREPLLLVDQNYAHGTGHGVGCYLCVHEAAANISPRGEMALMPGMLLSNEPGYYKEGEYGIRIENLVLVQENADDGMLYFETVTYAPLCTKLIEVNLLNDTERGWIAAYHAQVEEKLSLFLDKDSCLWLKDYSDVLLSVVGR